MAGIQIRALKKTFGSGAPALDDIDLEVRDGELLVVVGPSGSGKTTLLRLIAGLEQPTAGSIHLAGRDLTGIPPHRRQVALVFQDLALYSHLTVRQNLVFGLTSGAACDEVARLLGIEDLLERYPTQLSGGQQQRVALGRAVIRRPAALLLDEPLSSIDAPRRRSLRRELKQLQQQLGIPTIYVTHDAEDAMALGDRIAVLHDGQLQQVAPPGELYHRPSNRLVADLLGPQGMNFLVGTLEQRAGFSGFCGENVSVVVPAGQGPAAPLAGPIVLGIRPEGIDLLPPCESETGDSAAGVVEGTQDYGDARYVQVRMQAHRQLPTTIHQPPPALVVRAPDNIPPSALQVGAPVALRFHADRLHWFDSHSGQRMTPRTPVHC